ncbi:hypothetical protein CQ019_01665 [Arthrobacter sp. MYb229]|nr:hypothetical protein CQ019_01665 [Arthrobacter sp. MYb229]PRB53820.1 hypothetical protein CQ013_01665 [Arthrobacter sp. MYb216]
MYQPQFALLRLFELAESTEVYIEMDDDLDFVDLNGAKSLGSLKHKSVGDRLTDLSVDFWKSVRIWISRYKRDSFQESDLKFLLFTTSEISPTSYLHKFSSRLTNLGENIADAVMCAREALERSNTALSKEVRSELDSLTDAQREDFFARVTIIDSTPRISDIAEKIINRHMRSISREFRPAIFDRLLGWWSQEMILLLTGERAAPLSGYELSDKLSGIADEYKTNNLPIHFFGATPEYEIDAEGDQRQFVIQLREIGVQTGRIRNAILDYYRAYAQRSVWARENVLMPGEIGRFEAKLVDEWSRYRDVVFEDFDVTIANEKLAEAGKQLYRWADLESGNLDSLRIREKVTEPYVVRGGFHILANEKPQPRVYWHPTFLSRLDEVLG